MIYFKSFNLSFNYIILIFDFSKEKNCYLKFKSRNNKIMKPRFYQELAEKYWLTIQSSQKLAFFIIFIILEINIV